MNKRGEINKAMAIGLVAVTILAIVIGCLLILTPNAPQDKTMYQLSNGVLCKSYEGHFGSLRFRGCSDGNTYINPETYKKVEKSK